MQPRNPFIMAQRGQPKPQIERYEHKEGDIPLVRADISRTDIRIELLKLEIAHLRKEKTLQNDDINRKAKLFALENAKLEKKLLILLREKVSLPTSPEDFVEELEEFKNTLLKDLMTFYPEVDC
jgi:hypothetical protein